MKTLLMAIDHSPVAEKVVALTIEEALAHRAEVVVLCCVDPAYSSCNQPMVRQKFLMRLANSPAA